MEKPVGTPSDIGEKSQVTSETVTKTYEIEYNSVQNALRQERKETAELREKLQKYSAMEQEQEKKQKEEKEAMALELQGLREKALELDGIKQKQEEERVKKEEAQKKEIEDLLSTFTKEEKTEYEAMIEGISPEKSLQILKKFKGEKKTINFNNTMVPGTQPKSATTVEEKLKNILNNK